MLNFVGSFEMARKQLHIIISCSKNNKTTKSRH